jgi:nicotinate-nucleotide adenylyltransferase
MKIGLFFGSFNPVHIGHLIIAEFMAAHTDLQKVWMVVTPHNPHKPKKTLARDHDRLHLVDISIKDNPKIQVSSVEFGLPKPSYTIDTLAFLKEKHPTYQFALIMGGDSLATLPTWKNSDLILRDHEIYVYKRPSFDLGVLATHPKVHFVDAPLLEISATMIREWIAAGKSVRYLVPEPVFEYLSQSNMYKQQDK